MNRTAPATEKEPEHPDPAAPPDGPDDEGFSSEGLIHGLKRITPTLLLVGVATGAAFAVGSAIVQRWIFRGK